jgi:acid phosphatase (class A)
MKFTDSHPPRPPRIRGSYIFIPLILALCAVARANYVNSADFNFRALLPSPPAIGSAEQNAEIDVMLRLQSGRTHSDVKRIKKESKMTGFIFSPCVGSWFNPDNLPVTAAFLGKVFDDSKTICSAAKEVFLRQRPYLTDTRIHPCETEDTYSYPSSHSTRAMVLAMTIAQIFPDQKPALIALGRQIGDDRALAGQHFPSDVAAGRILADAVFKKMIQNPEFQSDLLKAKQECDARHPTPPATQP